MNDAYVINREVLSSNIKKIRLQKGLNQQQFGELFFPIADKSIVSRWEKGKSVPSAERLKKIAELGNMSVNELLYGSLANRVREVILNYSKEKNEPIHEVAFEETLESVTMFNETLAFDEDKIIAMYLLEQLADDSVKSEPTAKYDIENLTMTISFLEGDSIVSHFDFIETKKGGLIAAFTPSKEDANTILVSISQIILDTTGNLQKYIANFSDKNFLSFNMYYHHHLIQFLSQYVKLKGVETPVSFILGEKSSNKLFASGGIAITINSNLV